MAMPCDGMGALVARQLMSYHTGRMQTACCTCRAMGRISSPEAEHHQHESIGALQDAKEKVSGFVWLVLCFYKHAWPLCLSQWPFGCILSENLGQLMM